MHQLINATETFFCSFATALWYYIAHIRYFVELIETAGRVWP